MNPFEKQTKDIEEYFLSMEKMYPKAYNKKTTGPYSKYRVIEQTCSKMFW